MQISRLACNREIDKWILVTGAGTSPVSATEDNYHGKYDGPETVERVRNFRGLRGVRIYDATDPTSISLLSEWACDRGDPSRTVQTGDGAKLMLLHHMHQTPSSENMSSNGLLECADILMMAALSP